MTQLLYLLILLGLLFFIIAIFCKVLLLLFFNLSLDKPLTFIEIGKCIFELKVSEWEREMNNMSDEVNKIISRRIDLEDDILMADYREYEIAYVNWNKLKDYLYKYETVYYEEEKPIGDVLKKMEELEGKDE